MTTMKKLFALLLAVLMLLSVVGFAGAEEPTINNSITINDAKVGETYSLYTLFDLVVDDESNPAVYSYTINKDWEDFFKAAGEDGTDAGAGNKYIKLDETKTYVTEITDAAALAEAAAEWAEELNAAKTVIVAEGKTTAEFTDLPNGYHLITSTLGTAAMTDTTPDKKAVTINEKNPEDTITKTVKEDSTDNYGEENDAQIGDTIEFKSTATLYPNTRNVVIHDKMDSGLTYTAGSVTIGGLTAETDYTVNESPADGDTFDITFTDIYLESLTQKAELTITYTATLNAGAVDKVTTGEGESATTEFSIVAQNNTIQITYGDKQSVQAQTTTTTHKFSVFKYAESGTTENGEETDKVYLAGAEFSLKKDSTVVKLVKLDDNNYRVATNDDTTTVETFTTVADGDIVIWGVDSDSDYTLEEVTAPDGYNKLGSEIKVTVAADNSTRIEVENKSGAELPSTGGIGTTIFYVAGGVLVLLAVVLLVTKRRAGEEN